MAEGIPDEADSIDDAYDALLGRLDWPMVIVTASADDDGEKGGCLVGFHTQCSIEPRRHMVMISVENHTWSVAQRASRIAVHVLTADQALLARAFGEHTDDDGSGDKWAGVSVVDVAGTPILTDAAAWFAGPIVERLEVGDHHAIVMAPDRVEQRDDVARSGQFGFQQAKDFEPGHPA